MKGGEGVRYYFSFFHVFLLSLWVLLEGEGRENLGPTRTMNDPTRDMGWYVV